MTKLNNENWIYDDDNSAHAKKADEVLRRVKSSRIGKKYKYVVDPNNPRAILEIEDEDGEYVYGRKRK